MPNSYRDIADSVGLLGFWSANDLYEESDYVRCTCTDAAGAINEMRERLSAFEDAENQGRLVILPCKVGDTVWFYLYEDRYYLCEGIYQGVITQLKSVQRLNCAPLILAVIEYEIQDPWYGEKMMKSEMHCSFGEHGTWVQFYLTREEAEAALKGERKADGG